jgi:hypothetical protein
MQQTPCSTRCTRVPHAADNVHRAMRRAPMPHAAMHRSRGPNARRLRRAASPPAAAVRPKVAVDRTLAALLGRATSRACRHPGKPAGRRGRDHGVLWVLSAGGPRASGRRLTLAGLAWHTHRRLVQRVKSADDRSNVRCGAGSAACVRSATCRMQAGNSLACQNCQQVLLHVNAQRVRGRWAGVTGYYRAQYPVGVHFSTLSG